MAIVCGTDFSEHGTQVVRAAAALAGAWKVPLVVVHAMDMDGGGLYGFGRQAMLDAARRTMEELLAKEVPGEVDREGLVVLGAADELLASTARERNATLLVIGFLGRRGAGGFRLGSTADRLAQATPVPLLVVRLSEPIAAWIRGERPLWLMVGSDFSAVTTPALQWARRLGEFRRCETTYVYSYGPFTEHHRMLLPPSQLALDGDPVVERTLEQELADRLGGLRPGERVRAVVNPAGNSVGDHLSALATREQIDLLVVGSHQRQGFGAVWHGSVARRVLDTAEGSVLLVPRTDAGEEAKAPVRVRTLLVPTDLSPEGDRAIAWAAAMAPDDATLVLLHVSTEGGSLSPSEAEKLRQALESRIPEAARSRRVRFRVELTGGIEVAEAICEAADRFGVDAVCLGTHGRTGMRRLFAGSVASRVLARCDRTVLLVRPPR